ncbi:MAG: efflux RND transporter periplasmic adaptor subunit [Gemmatimonadaceae bacterium]
MALRIGRRISNRKASVLTLTLTLALASIAGCSGDSKNASASPVAGAGAGGGRGQNGGPGGPGGGPGGPGGGRGGASVVLAASDVATVGRSTIEEATPVTGDLRPIETVEIRARLEGDLEGVYVREGDRVRRGQLLARFENSEQESGRQSAEAGRVAAQTELTTAQWSLDQSEELFKAGAIPERDLKVAQQGVASARARLAAADAQVRSTTSFVTDTRVLATTTGVIAERHVENGEHVARGAPIFTLVRNDVLELAAAMPARRASGVAAGQTVHFSADGRAFDGRVARVSPTIDPATRAVTVFMQVPNADGALKGGTFATGRVVGRTRVNVLVIPTAALRQSDDEGERQYVYRINGQTLAPAQLSLGTVDETRGVAEVLDGLQEGDRIVVGNVGTLGEGMRVEIVGNEGQGRGRQGAGGRQGADSRPPGGARGTAATPRP